jgi:hypothetical protein
MTTRLSVLAVGHATSLFLAVTYSLCVVFDLLFPQHAMYTAWEKLLPGFAWISWGAYFIGLIESYLYGWYFAVVWVPLYRVFAMRAAR